MKDFRLAAVLVVLAASCKQGGGSVNLVTAEDSVSYIVGYQIGGQVKSMKQQGAPTQADQLTAGLRDALTEGKPRFTPDEMRTIVTAYQKKKADSAVTKNSKAGEAFLAENAKKEGVKTTPSGLQYKPVREGKGAHPKANSTVTVHYKGTLLNGTPFDSSYGSAPVSFPLDRVIKGWGEGVQLMTPGSKYQFWIPAALAYGENGSPPAIGPSETLAFEIELISFK